MLKYIVLIVLLAVGKVGWDNFAQSRKAKNMDAYMEKLAAEMNGKLPMEAPHARITEVAYANRTLSFSGQWAAGIGDDAMRNQFQNTMHANYCGGERVFPKNKITVQYDISIPSTNFNNTRPTPWQLALRPDMCP
jgi:hypothetical protein